MKWRQVDQEQSSRIHSMQDSVEKQRIEPSIENDLSNINMVIFILT